MGSGSKEKNDLSEEVDDHLSEEEKCLAEFSPW